MEQPLWIYIIAGEASGDLLGAKLMQSLRAQSTRELKFHGVGGPRMEAEGLKSLFPYQELSLLGFVEVLPHALKVFERVHQTVEDIMTKHPEIIVTIDVPGFSFRVIKKMREAKYKARYIHYVAPTVWAYKPGRAQVCAELFNHLLTLLPFEKPYFDAVNLPCTFVGHPVISEATPGDPQAFRKKYEIDENATLFCLLPGSRKGEITRHMPIFARAVTLLATVNPKLALVVAVPKQSMHIVAPYFEKCPFRAVITSDDKDKKDALATSNLAIVKSGTVALEVALAGVPMLVTYRVQALSAWLFKRISLTKYINLINIVLQREVIPELIQELCNPLAIATAASELLQSPERQRLQKEQAAYACAQLVPPAGQKPSDIAARTILGDWAAAPKE